MRKEIYTIYCNNEAIAIFGKKELAKKYIEYLNFYSFNDMDRYYYRKEFIYV